MYTTSHPEHTQTHAGLSSKLFQTQAIQHTVDVGFIVFFVFLSEIELNLANPRVLTLWA